MKHNTKKFNFVDTSFKRSDYQSVNIKITKSLFTLQKKLSMINSIKVNVISKVCVLCAVISQNFCFKNVSFEIEFLKSFKNENFISISSFIKKIANHAVIFDIFRVIAIILTNNAKNF